MSFELILQLLGWAMVGIPLIIWLFIAAHLTIGAAKDDPPIMALVMLGTTIVVIGAAILIFTYTTDILPRVFSPAAQTAPTGTLERGESADADYL